MKKLLAAMMAALCVLCCLSSCGSENPTPKQIYQSVAGADSVRVEIVMNFDDITEYRTVIEQAGKISRIEQAVVNFGATDGDEFYLQKEGDKRYIYTEKDGVWSRRELHKLETVATLEGLEPLFADDFYAEDEDCYRMSASSAIKLEDLIYTKLVLSPMEGGYQITGIVAQELEEMTLTGKLTITFTKLGEVTVTLPKV